MKFCRMGPPMLLFCKITICFLVILHEVMALPTLQNSTLMLSQWCAALMVKLLIQSPSEAETATARCPNALSTVNWGSNSTWLCMRTINTEMVL